MDLSPEIEQLRQFALREIILVQHFSYPFFDFTFTFALSPLELLNIFVLENTFLNLYTNISPKSYGPYCSNICFPLRLYILYLRESSFLMFKIYKGY